MSQEITITELSPKESLLKCFRMWEKQWTDYKGEGSKPMTVDELSEFIGDNYEIKFKQK